MSFWGELRRRGVLKVGFAYLAFAWLVVQVGAIVLPVFGAPLWVLRTIIVAFVLAFPIAALVAWRYELTPDGLQRDAGSATAVQRMPGRGRALDFAIIGFLVLALAALVVERSLVDTELTAPRSIAVLPLANLTGDPEREYFVDGMTDALITSLAKMRSLRVVSRTSVMHYKGAAMALPAIAAALGVQMIVEGSATYDRGRVRITAQLIDAATDQHLWADSYDRALEDVLALQSQVALDIASEIAIAISPDEEARLLRTRRVNPETYQAYLRGMYYLYKASPEDIEAGLAYLHEAVDRDPGDPLAYAGLAFGYVTLAHAPAPPADAAIRAQAAALRALNLDPDLAEGYAALAEVKLYFEWDFPGAEHAFLRALELNPSLAMNRYHYAWYLANVGRLDEAIAEHTKARELDPLTPLHTAWLGGLYAFRGDYASARAWAERSLDLAPGFPAGLFVLGAAYLGEGRHAEAIRTHEALVAAVPDYKPMLGATYALTGDEAKARAILAELEAGAQESSSWTALGLALVHAALGDDEQAAYWIAHEPHHAFTAGIALDPLLERQLRDQPRYQELLARLDLPAGSCCYAHSIFGSTR